MSCFYFSDCFDKRSLVEMLITWLRRGCSSLWHVLFMICMVRLANCYKPVILMHGILDKASDLSDLANFITKVGINLHHSFIM